MPVTRRKVKKRSCETTCNSCNDGDASVNVLNFTRCDGVQQDQAKKQRQLQMLKSGDDVITCSSFGPDRNIKFPGYHFCTPCREWDNRPMENKRLNQKMKVYRCKVKHTSYVVPGEKIKRWQPSRDLLDTDKASEQIEVEQTTPDVNTNCTH